MATTPEGAIKRKLDKMLKSEPVWHFPPQAGAYGKAGVPDRIVCAGGQFIGIEAKADKTKTLTRLQEITRDEIISRGGIYVVVYDDATIELARQIIRDCTSGPKGIAPKTE